MICVNESLIIISRSNKNLFRFLVHLRPSRPDQFQVVFRLPEFSFLTDRNCWEISLFTSLITPNALYKINQCVTNIGDAFISLIRHLVVVSRSVDINIQMSQNVLSKQWKRDGSNGNNLIPIKQNKIVHQSNSSYKFWKIMFYIQNI